MAIAHSSTTVATNAGTDTLTISNHVVGGSFPVLIVKVATRDKTQNLVTGITWNTTEDLVQLNSDINGDAGVELWYLKAPTATTADVVISMSDSNRCVAAASTYTGVNQTNPFRVAGAASANGTNDSPTVGVDALDTEMVIDSLCQVSAGPDTAVGDHTERHNDAATGGGTDTRGASQEKASSGAVETMGWTMSDADNWAIAAGPLQEPPPPVGQFMTPKKYW